MWLIVEFCTQGLGRIEVTHKEYSRFSNQFFSTMFYELNMIIKTGYINI